MGKRKQAKRKGSDFACPRLFNASFQESGRRVSAKCRFCRIERKPAHSDIVIITAWGVVYKMKYLGKIFCRSMVLSLFFALGVQSSAVAFDGAVLKGIKIDLLKNQDYRIYIKTDKDAPVKKYITASNKVVLDIKNIRPAKFVNTVYNDASEIDHVIVQPVSNDRLRVFLKGTNISSSKVILDTRDETLEFLQPEPVVQNTANVKKVSKEPAFPVSSQNSKTTGIKAGQKQPEPLIIDLSDNKSSGISANNREEETSPIMPLVSYKEKAVANTGSLGNYKYEGAISGISLIDWILRGLMLAVIIAAVAKIFRKPKNIEIDIASSVPGEKEMDIYKTADSRKELLTKSLGMPAKKQNASKKPNYASISQYGLNEYKNSQLPPRKTTTPMSSKSINQGIKPKSAPKNTSEIKSKAKVKPQQLNKTTVTQKQKTEARQNFDSVKFLETMASIYQKSGRDDLALGIRQNIIQKQQSA